MPARDQTQMNSLRAQFRIIGAALIGVVLVACLLVVASLHQLQQSQGVMALAERIGERVGKVSQVFAEALQSPGAARTPVRQSWAAAHQGLQGDLDALPEEFAAVVDAARRILQRSQEAVALIADGPDGAARMQGRQVLQAALHELATTSAEITSQARVQSQKAVRSAYWAPGLGALLVVLWALGSSQFLRIRVLRVLYRFAHQVRAYGQGDRGVRLPLGQSREFDDLALAFNREADALEATMVSRDALQAEVRARTEAQAQALQALASLERSSEKLQLAASVFSNAVEGVMITSADGVIVEVNRAFTEITGYSRDDAVGQTPKMLRSGQHGAEFYRQMWQDILKTGTWSGEVWNRTKTGHTYPEHLTISTVRNEAGDVTHYIGFFEDISESVEAQQHMQQLAHFDALTQLPNRMLLTDRLEQALLQCARSGQSAAVVFLDLDGFKNVNDSYDHQTGDALLVALTERMRAALRNADTLARVGGDEFVAILNGVDKQADVQALVSRLLEAAHSRVSVEFDGRQVELQVSASAGVTVYPEDNSPAGVLIRHADSAMYQAKQSGKNRFHRFDLAHDTKVQQEKELVRSVREGIGRGEFVLMYQPKLNLSTNKIYGVEALVRWQHPKLGMRTPIDFLPQIENDASNEMLGFWVLQEAVSQWRRWHEEGIDLSVSVNISARQLHSPYFFERLADVLGSSPDMPPERLELEVLETSALENIEKVSESMKACIGLGVQFALDDFGTGYSTLTYLKQLPARTLKIDQTFVRNMLQDEGDLVIVQGVISLAQTFGREVIAEGVESAAHADKLLQMGCSCVQGYAIAPPLASSSVKPWLAKWSGLRLQLG